LVYALFVCILLYGGHGLKQGIIAGTTKIHLLVSDKKTSNHSANGFVCGFYYGMPSSIGCIAIVAKEPAPLPTCHQRVKGARSEPSTFTLMN
jgi:hypothetical protein